jgi:hypothetical protein
LASERISGNNAKRTKEAAVLAETAFNALLLALSATLSLTTLVAPSLAYSLRDAGAPPCANGKTAPAPAATGGHGLCTARSERAGGGGCWRLWLPCVIQPGAIFSPKEDLAIIEDYVRASNNPLKGANQKESVFMRKEYIRNHRRPFESAEEQTNQVSVAPHNDECRQHSRWYSRNARSIRRHALELKAACPKLHGK